MLGQIGTETRAEQCQKHPELSDTRGAAIATKSTNVSNQLAIPIIGAKGAAIGIARAEEEEV